MDIGESLSAYLQADFKLTHSKIIVNIFFDILLKNCYFFSKGSITWQRKMVQQYLSARHAAIHNQGGLAVVLNVENGTPLKK